MSFLADLQHNNNREWFEANRDRYEEALVIFTDFTEKLIDKLILFDPSLEGVSTKESIYRIYRDLRFSKNKQPYKINMSAFISRGGRSSSYAGYYVHIEPKGSGIFGGNVVLVGSRRPKPNILKSIRDEIYDNGDAVADAINKLENQGFELSQHEKLIRMPMGFEAGGEYDELLKQKNIIMIKYLADDFMLQPNLEDKVAQELSYGKDLVEIINRAVQFALEEM